MIEFVKWLHILSAAVLFGTGAGIAFFMFAAARTRDPAAIAHVGRSVVIADFLFTASAVVVQPVSGIILARLEGLPLATPWIAHSIALYLAVGACWLPVVWIQMRLRDLARDSVAQGEPLDSRFDRLLRWWVGLGIPAFLGVLAIYWLMVAKPG